MKDMLSRIEFLLQSLVRRQRTCPHCERRECKIVARKYWVIRIRRCAGCGLAFTDPIYRSLFTGAFYEDAYDTGDLTTQLPTSQELAQLKATKFAGTNKDFSTQLAGLGVIAPGPRWAELGSSWGYFLYQAGLQKVDATGVELCVRRRTFGNDSLGVRIVANMDRLPDASFDLVYSSHVLEHFTDLRRIFADIHRVLRPGGMLVIEVPNVDLQQFGNQVLIMMGAVHPIGFDGRFFTNALPGYGFEDVRIYNDYAQLGQDGVSECSNDSLLVSARRARD